MARAGLFFSLLEFVLFADLQKIAPIRLKNKVRKSMKLLFYIKS